MSPFSSRVFHTITANACERKAIRNPATNLTENSMLPGASGFGGAVLDAASGPVQWIDSRSTVFAPRNSPS
jgi:hypothetical protein